MAVIVKEVAEIPKVQKRKRCTRNELLGRLDDCMSADVPCGMVIFTDGEYSGVTSARASLQASAERYGYALQFETRSNKLYFKRTDY